MVSFDEFKDVCIPYCSFYCIGEKERKTVIAIELCPSPHSSIFDLHNNKHRSPFTPTS